MIALARVGDLVALLTLIMGMGLWQFLATPQRMIVAFCGVSAVCGMGQAALSSIGVSTAFFGNAWDLAVLLLLCPSLWRCMRSKRREIARFLWACAVAVWITCLVVDGDMQGFVFNASAIIYGVVAFTALLLVEQFASDPATATRSPAFLRGVTLLGVCTVDAMVTAMLPHVQVFGLPFLVAAMAFRNLLWIIAYAAFMRSLLLVERAPRGPKPDPVNPDATAATMSIS